MKPDRESASLLAEVLADAEADFATEHCDFTVGDRERGGPEGVPEPESPKGYGGADIHRSRRGHTTHTQVVMALTTPDTATIKPPLAEPAVAPPLDPLASPPPGPVTSPLASPLPGPVTSPLASPLASPLPTPPASPLPTPPAPPPASGPPPTPSAAPNASPQPDPPTEPAAAPPLEAIPAPLEAIGEPLGEAEPDFAVEHCHLTVGGSDHYRTRRH